MKMRYVAKGLVLMKDRFVEPTKISSLETSTLDEIQKKLEELLKADEIAVFDFKGAKGDIVGITEESSVEFEGDEFIRTKKYLHFVGDLTQEEMDKLQNLYFKYLVD